MEELIEILEDIRPDIDFENEKQLMSGGILNSLDILAIMDSVESEFGVRIPPRYMTAENFNSAEALWALVSRLSE